MTNRRTVWRAAAIPLASAIALVSAGGWLLANDDGAAHWSGVPRGGGVAYSSMMADGAGMMGGGAGAGNGRPVPNLDAARERAQVFAGNLDTDLQVGEVMRFSNSYYADLVTASGDAATEVLVDESTGAVYLEPGPAMMWNSRYGAMAAPSGPGPRLGVEAAEEAALTWLNRARPDLTVADPERFPGYYTMHTIKDGVVEGMLSVNATTGDVWYHSWHGEFVEMAEAQ